MVIPLLLCGCREQDGQASGGDESDSDKWIFNTIREKDLKKCQNGSAQPDEMEKNQVKCLFKRIRIIILYLPLITALTIINLYRFRRIQRGLCHKAYLQSFLQHLQRY